MPFVPAIGAAVLPAVAGSTIASSVVGAGVIGSTLATIAKPILGAFGGAKSGGGAPQLPQQPSVPSFQQQEQKAEQDQRRRSQRETKTILSERRNLLTTQSDETKSKQLLGV